MAIYDLGTASLSANGEVTGVGTKWKAPLTLIRVGATIVFKTEPVQIYTISEIISDTQINVYNPNSETVTAGTGYAILAHDGITVQGLAQDVAETLRYYQSSETEVADAVDAFNNFDANDFNSKVTQVNTQHGDVVSIGAQVSADADQVSSDKDSAAASASSASSDKDAAAISAQEAANYAASLDATNLLRKDMNFSDVADKSLARDNLGLKSLSTLDAVPVTKGGTGASTSAGARINIGALSNTPEKTAAGGTGDRVKHAAGAGLFNLDMFNCYWYMQPEDTNFWIAHAVSYAGSGGESSGYGRIAYAIRIADGTVKYVQCRTDKNTTVDPNGFVKQASPVVNIYANGRYETNDESEGVSVIRQGIGEYLITGCLGLNSDARWGGVDGGFEIPIDRNKQPRVWLDYEVKEDGSILVKTYHRTHPTSPVFARNEIEGFADGDPIDIPSDAFISVRVGMPTE